MKRIALYLFLLATLPVAAQTETALPEPVQAEAAPMLKYGYLSYDSVMNAMSEYADMQAEMAQLRSYYDAEMKRVEDDFNKKYEEFLDSQSSFPKTILQKRQSELQEMLDKNITFKKESLQLLNETEKELLAALRGVITAAVAQIGQERGYAFILNTDANATPWLNGAMGDDITRDVIAVINK